MRIIGGQFRGRKIEQPDSKTIRPTKDRIREALFNMIAERIPYSEVLDLFAGSGAFGLEMLSRGAKKAVFVDNDPLSAETIRNNVKSLEIAEYSEIIMEDAFRHISIMFGQKQGFDIIFVDPPYNMGLAKKSLILINQYDILNPSGLLILEHHVDEKIFELAENITILKQKTYKNISVSIFRKND